MKSLAVSAKYKVILFVVMIPIAILFYHFISEKNEAIAALQLQLTQLDELRIHAEAIQRNVFTELGANKNSEVDFKDKLNHLEHLSIGSHLLFESSIYGYYLVQLSLNEMPLLYEKLFRLEHLFLAPKNRAPQKTIELVGEIKSLLLSISETTAKAVRLQKNNGGRQRLASSLLMIQTLQNFDAQLMAWGRQDRFHQIFSAEKKDLDATWNQSFQVLQESLQNRARLLTTNRNQYLGLLTLLILISMLVTIKTFSDLSSRIQKLTLLTKSNPGDLAFIQSGDFGYDEIGQLAQSFHTMSLIIQDNYQKLVESNTQLAEATAQAEMATRAKSLFIANVSHEIRTPINGILGMTKILSQTNLEPEQKKYLGILQKSSDMLLILINDILDLSKIENNKMTLEQMTFSPNDALTDIFECLAPLGVEKKLNISIQDHLPKIFVNGDFYKLKQILFNLLSNAIKFTSKGNVTVFLETMGEDSSRIQVKMGVRDQGTGISAENLKLLFHDFVQADASTTRRFGGTGLGLSLAKKLAELMGGNLFVTSVLGEGSCFWLEIDFLKADIIPMVDVNTAEDISVPKIKMSAMKILVAEDNPVNMLIIEKFLLKLGHDCLRASNGQQAIEICEQEKDIDLILMDCQMPILDGYRATELIRGHSSLQIRNIPIVALTANAMDSDETKCRNAGMNDFLTKPLDYEKVQTLLGVYSYSQKAA